MAGNQSDGAELHDCYRATVSCDPGLLRLYSEILNKFGTEGFSRHVAFLTRTLGQEIASASPSVEPARLREILGGLSALRGLDTVHECCEKMVNRIQRRSMIDITPAAVMRQLLPLVEDAVPSPSKIIAIPERFGISSVRLDLQIAVLRESRNLLAMIPVGAYRNLEARIKTLQAVEAAMDFRIEQEESA
ncbi:TyeA family type III secretion system gatekeeper subunit [Mesorhizobium sp. M0016]|uniref:TyeA family type III secretion system gatekeeper subunit n=1 Tax=Mesorhizobium sp. M0016 TaxID=2956843 RepID=UPI003338674E